jgi:hypothetical protein
MFFKWDQLLVLIIQRVEENLKKVEIPRLLPLTSIPDINGSPTRGEIPKGQRGGHSGFFESIHIVTGPSFSNATFI